jgi:hypothetical protein
MPIRFSGLLGTPEGYRPVFDLVQGGIDGAGTAPAVSWILWLVRRIMSVAGISRKGLAYLRAPARSGVCASPANRPPEQMVCL